MVDFGYEIVQANKRDSDNKICLNRVYAIITDIVKHGFGMLIATGIAAVIMPFVSYYFVGHLDPIWPTYIPGLDENEPVGYSILTLHHLTVTFIFVVGTSGYMN